MDMASVLFVITFALIAILAWAAIRAKGRAWRKAMALCALALLVPLLYIDVSELMGRPKPTSMEWFRDMREEVVVVGADIREGVAIYIWVRRKDEIEPRAYVLEWDQDTAVQLKETADLAEQMATDVMAKLPAEEEGADQRTRLVFYAEPQAALPEKPDPELPGMIFQPSVQPAP